jgi:hypothetical protein
MHSVLYSGAILKRLEGEIAQSQGGLSKLSPLRSDGALDSQTGGWTSWEVAKGIQRQHKLAQGSHHAWVHADQMALMMAWWDAGLCWQLPKALKRRVETTLGSHGTWLKTGIVTASKGPTYSFSGYGEEKRCCCSWWWWYGENHRVTTLSDATLCTEKSPGTTYQTAKMKGGGGMDDEHNTRISLSWVTLLS